MSDPGGISRLDKWRATREYLAWQLRLADQKVRELDAQEKRGQPQREQARAASSWQIQPQRFGNGTVLHRGSCTLCRDDFGFTSREDAVSALARPDTEPCQICNPHTGLE